jgi:hypothetical protein
VTIDYRTQFLLAAVAGAVLVMPTTYNTYDSKDGSFLIECPAGWEVKGGGNRGSAWAKFTSGSAEVTVDTDLAGSLMGDIAKSQLPILSIEGGENAPTIEKVHESDREAFDQEWGAKEGKPVAVATRLGDSRKSEFTGAGMLGGTFHGYRVTALSRDKRIRVICRCSEAEWQSLQPAFDKMIASVAMGTAAF